MRRDRRMARSGEARVSDFRYSLGWPAMVAPLVLAGWWSCHGSLWAFAALAMAIVQVPAIVAAEEWLFHRQLEPALVDLVATIEADPDVQTPMDDEMSEAVDQVLMVTRRHAGVCTRDAGQVWLLEMAERIEEDFR